MGSSPTARTNNILPVRVRPRIPELRKVNQAGPGLALKAMGAANTRMEFDSASLPPLQQHGEQL